MRFTLVTGPEPTWRDGIHSDPFWAELFRKCLCQRNVTGLRSPGQFGGGP